MENTPLHEAKNLANKLGIKNILLKLESVNPISHTFKDRGAIAAINEAKKTNNYIVAATCSNMGTAVSGAAAMAGMDSFVIVSDEAATITKKAIYNFSTEAITVKGDFNQIDDIVRKYSLKHPIPCINSNLHHFFRDGFRSILSELVGQISHDEKYVVVVPTADGTLLSALIDEYESLRSKPEIRFVVAQPIGCAPIVNAINDPSLHKYTPLDRSTTSIVPLSVRDPFLYGNQIVSYIKNHSGIAVKVSDDSATQNAAILAKLEGIFTDIVGGVVISAIEQIKNFTDDNETIIGLMTGNGLIDYDNKSYIAEKVRSLQEAEDLLTAFVEKQK